MKFHFMLCLFSIYYRINMESLKKVSLSDADLEEAFNRLDDGKPPIITYPELQDIQDLDEIFDKSGRVIILYLTESPTIGHWTCIMKKRSGYEFFDPYGNAPDTQFEWIGQDKAEALGQPTHRLTELLNNAHKPTYFNPHELQKDRKDINTCGKHVLCRLLLKDTPLGEYISMIKRSGKTPDDFVSLLTLSLIDT